MVYVANIEKKNNQLQTFYKKNHIIPIQFSNHLQKTTR